MADLVLFQLKTRLATNATKSEPLYLQFIMYFQHEKFNSHNMKSAVCWYEPINSKSRFPVYKADSLLIFDASTWTGLVIQWMKIRGYVFETTLT